MLDEIINYQQKIFNRIKYVYKRKCFDNIDLDKKLVGLIGARGVGKTTFLVYYLKKLDFFKKRGFFG